MNVGVGDGGKSTAGARRRRGAMIIDTDLAHIISFSINICFLISSIHNVSSIECQYPSPVGSIGRETCSLRRKLSSSDVTKCLAR